MKEDDEAEREKLEESCPKGKDFDTSNNNMTETSPSVLTSNAEQVKNDNRPEEDENERMGKWMELMGKDLRMKVYSSEKPEQNDDENGDVNDAGFTKPDCQPDLGDAIIIDFVGRRLCSDDESTNFLDDETDQDNNNNNNDDISRFTSSDKHIFHEGKGWLITLGDGDVCPALEMTVRFMHLHERAIAVSHSKYAYGLSGRRRGVEGETAETDYTLPANSTIVYDVYIHSVIGSSTEQFDSDEFLIRRALSKKIMGNDCYRNEWDDRGLGIGKSRALKLYKSASDLLIGLVNKMREQRRESSGENNNVYVEQSDLEKEATSILTDCLNNIAALHMRSKSYGLAKESAANVLRFDPNNRKALCRAAKAAMLDPAGTYEESDAAIKAAEEMHAGDPEVKKLRMELEQRKREYKKKEKEMYAKMMKGVEGGREVSSDGKDDSGVTSFRLKEITSEEVVDTSRSDRRTKIIVIIASLLISAVSTGILKLLFSWIEKNQKHAQEDSEATAERSSEGEIQDEF